MFDMSEEFVSDNLFWDDEAWAFPILPCEENDGKILIEGGRIVTDAANFSNAEREEAPPPVIKETKKGATAKASSATSKRGGGGNQGNEGSGGGGDSDDHESHIWTERERRKKMRNMFATLHDLIPQIHPRADKSSIVDEAINYIKRLHILLATLEKKKEILLKGGNIASITSCDPSTSKLAMIPSREAFMAEQGSTSTQGPVTRSSPNPLFAGPEYPPTFKSWTSPNLTLNICGKDAHISICCPKKLGFLTAILYVMERYNLELVSAQVSSDRGARMYMIHARINIGGQFPEALIFPVEEIFKQAAAEILIWLNF